MTEAKENNTMNTIDEQTAWPDDGSAATADAMIRYFARRAAISNGIADASMHVYFSLNKGDAAHDETGRDWVAKVDAFVTKASIAALLVLVQKRDRGMADALASELYDLIDAGDVWGELGWDWLTERGVDAKAVYDDAHDRAKVVSS